MLLRVFTLLNSSWQRDSGKDKRTGTIANRKYDDGSAVILYEANTLGEHNTKEVDIISYENVCVSLYPDALTGSKVNLLTPSLWLR